MSLQGIYTQRAIAGFLRVIEGVFCFFFFFFFFLYLVLWLQLACQGGGGGVALVSDFCLYLGWWVQLVG